MTWAFAPYHKGDKVRCLRTFVSHILDNAHLDFGQEGVEYEVDEYRHDGQYIKIVGLAEYGEFRGWLNAGRFERAWLKPIEEAPRDGTVIRVYRIIRANTKHPIVRAKWIQAFSDRGYWRNLDVAAGTMRDEDIIGWEPVKET